METKTDHYGKKILMDDEKLCDECKGEGKIGKDDCEICKGKGIVKDWSKDEQPEELVCLKCGKKFWIPNRKCNITWKRPICDDCQNKMTAKDREEWFDTEEAIS